jgi:hypothetical protein
MSLKFKSSSKVVKGITTRLAKSETNDCVVRGIASAFNTTYNKAHKFVKDTYKRKDRKGTNAWRFHNETDKMADNGIKVFGKKIVKIQYEPVQVKRTACSQRETWYQESRSYTYMKTLTLYTKRGSKYSQMTVGGFIKAYPKGTFILSVSEHVFTVKDGVVIGNYGDSKKMRVWVEKAWQVK